MQTTLILKSRMPLNVATEFGVALKSDAVHDVRLQRAKERLHMAFSPGAPLRMVPGEKRRFWIPETLAYRGQPDKPAGTLVFDIELLRIVS